MKLKAPTIYKSQNYRVGKGKEEGRQGGMQRKKGLQ
jgi:hypothetical protein